MANKAVPFLLFLAFSLIIVPSSSMTPPQHATSASAYARSFYRRPLPDSCVALSSRQGRRLFESALQTKGLQVFFSLVEQHTTQAEPAYCGLSTLLIALNTFAVDPRQTWKGPWRWYDESLLNCCMDLEDVKKTGITLPTFQCLAICQGLDAAITYADDDDDEQGGSNIENFRKAVQNACVESANDDQDEDERISNILVVSYTRQVLGQTGSGHFSPIAAYDNESDSVLILDTARFKYGSHWVKLPLLHEAMKPIDSDTGRSRGYVMLAYHPDHDDNASSLPLSVLLRSRMKQNPVRREFKQYQNNLPAGHEVSWDEVVDYWTKGGTAPKFVWSIVEPQLKPMHADQEVANALCAEVRTLILDLLPSRTSCTEATLVVSDCGPNHCRALSLRPEEAMYVLYLACLDKEEREKIVRCTALSSASESARVQLLAEAELVEIAIEMSDK